MNSIISSLRDVLGAPNFLVDGSLDYGLLLEYFFAGTILCIVISAVFRIIVGAFK